MKYKMEGLKNETENIMSNGYVINAIIFNYTSSFGPRYCQCTE